MTLHYLAHHNPMLLYIITNLKFSPISMKLMIFAPISMKFMIFSHINAGKDQALEVLIRIRTHALPPPSHELMPSLHLRNIFFYMFQCWVCISL